MNKFTPTEYQKLVQTLISKLSNSYSCQAGERCLSRFDKFKSTSKFFVNHSENLLKIKELVPNHQSFVFEILAYHSQLVGIALVSGLC